MITIKHINKTYNKGKRNENHVLKDITLEFPSKGLVMLLGDSGSGKTTLLNVLGGLDAFDKGQLSVEDTTLNKYKPEIIDGMRNTHTGYIFQNYYLLPNDTVYDNIAISLRMKGLKDPKEIDNRINHLLKLVGLPQYKSRNANQLSGGQQQRIAIARALSKDPNIIIADEPTGNLDRRNTLQIMNILKQISKNKLIIMVTHEETLADHYADQIIRLKDGEITEGKRTATSGTLDTTTESDIYLGDLEHLHESTSDNHHIDLYTDHSQRAPIKAKLIVQNNTLYIDVEDDAFKNVHIIKDSSDTNVYEEKRAVIAKQETTLPSINYPPITESESTKKSVINTKQTVRMAIAKLRRSSRFSKALYASFMFTAAIFAVALAMFANVYRFDDDAFLTRPKTHFEVEIPPHMEEIEAIENQPFITSFVPNQTEHISFQLPRFYNRSSAFNTQQPVVPLSLLDETTIIHGRMPESPFEIVVNKRLADNFLTQYNMREAGVTSYDDLLKLGYSPNIMPVGESRIVGITAQSAPVIYMNESLIYSLLTVSPYNAYDLYEDHTTLVQGQLPTQPNHAIIPDNGEPFEPFNLELSGQTINVVGTYELDNGHSHYVLLHRSALRHMYVDSLAYMAPRYFHVNDEAAAEQYFTEQDIPFVNLYEYEQTEEQLDRLSGFSGLLIFTIIAMGGSAAAYYFIIRSSMLKRIYEIGVYRAIGVRRRDVVKLFMIEILMLTTFTSLIGYLGMRYALNYIDRVTGEIAQIFNLSALTFVGGILMIYLINLVFGLLPLFRLLRKTPAQILSSYDL